MKIFAFLMSVYMLLLSCVPCGDSTECDKIHETTISAAFNHQGHNHNAEACTPFCSCSCCAATAFFIPLSKSPFTRLIFAPQKYPLYNITYATDVYSSIWQPPQLS